MLHHTEIWLIEHMLNAAEAAAQEAEMLDGQPKRVEFRMRP